MADWTIIRLLSWTESYFKQHAIDSPRLTAEILLAHSLGLKRIDLYMQFDRPLQKNELADFKVLIKRRRQHEPVAYITGEKGFFDSEFMVTDDVLIPRPDTETLVEQAIDILNARPAKGAARVLELGTGSGAVIVSLAKAMPDNLYFANDVSCEAVEIAVRNAESILGGRGSVAMFSGDWFSGLSPETGFDLIVSNPPYIPLDDIPGLAPEISGFEPVKALDGGIDGLDCFRIIIGQAHRFLAKGGALLLEMGSDQKQGIEEIAGLYDAYLPPVFKKDLAGNDRVALIKKIN